MIDPRISLEARPTQNMGPDWASINQGQQTTQNMVTAATQQPGLIAEAAMKQRVNAGEQWAQDNAYKFKDKDGNIDMPKMANAMHLAGFTDQANGVYAHWADNGLKSIKTAKDRTELFNGLRTGAGASLLGVPPGTARNSAARIAEGQIDTYGKIPGTNTDIGKEAMKSYYLYDENGQPIKDTNGNYIVDDTKVDGVKEEILGPGKAEEIRAARKAKHDDADSNRIDSQKSQNTQALAVRLGMANKDSPPQTDYYWYNNTEFLKRLDNLVPEKTTIEKYKDEAMKAGDTIRLIDTVKNSAPANGPALWRPFQTAYQFIQKFRGDPQWAGWIAMLEKAQASGLEGIDLKSQPVDAVLNILDKHREVASNVKGAREYMLSNPTAPMSTKDIPSAGEQPLGMSRQQSATAPAATSSTTQEAPAPIAAPMPTKAPTSGKIATKAMVDDVFARAAKSNKPLTKEAIRARFKENGYSIEGE